MAPLAREARAAQGTSGACPARRGSTLTHAGARDRGATSPAPPVLQATSRHLSPLRLRAVSTRVEIHAPAPQAFICICDVSCRPGEAPSPRQPVWPLGELAGGARGGRVSAPQGDVGLSAPLVMESTLQCHIPRGPGLEKCDLQAASHCPDSLYPTLPSEMPCICLSLLYMTSH